MLDSINGLTMPFLSELRKMLSYVCESLFLTFFRKISAKYRQNIGKLYKLVWKCISCEFDIKMFISFTYVYMQH